MSRDAQHQPIKELSPEASEAMRRQFFAGLRALTYGSLVGIVGVTAVATLAAYTLDIGDAASLRTNIKSSLIPVRSTFERLFKPLQGRGGGVEGASKQSGGGVRDSLFAKELKKRFEKLRTTAL